METRGKDLEVMVLNLSLLLFATNSLRPVGGGGAGRRDMLMKRSCEPMQLQVPFSLCKCETPLDTCYDEAN